MIDNGTKRALWAAADKLRSNMDAAEYKHIVLGLIFLKYVSDAFAERRAELARRFADPNDDYFIAEELLRRSDLEERDYYTEANVFWVPEKARWEHLRNNAKQPDIGKIIDDALVEIESENPRLKGILDKRFARTQLEPGTLGALVDHLFHRLHGQWSQSSGCVGAGLRILFGAVCQCRRKEGRTVLYARVGRACVG
jgi:type I restriction enzyme M protein